MSDAATGTVIRVGPTNVEARYPSAMYTLLAGVKPVPSIVRVKSGLPAVTSGGVNAETASGVPTALKSAMANSSPVNKYINVLVDPDKPPPCHWVKVHPAFGVAVKVSDVPEL